MLSEPEVFSFKLPRGGLSVVFIYDPIVNTGAHITIIADQARLTTHFELFFFGATHTHGGRAAVLLLCPAVLLLLCLLGIFILLFSCCIFIFFILLFSDFVPTFFLIICFC